MNEFTIVYTIELTTELPASVVNAIEKSNLIDREKRSAFIDLASAVDPHINKILEICNGKELAGIYDEDGDELWA